MRRGGVGLFEIADGWQVQPVGRSVAVQAAAEPISGRDCAELAKEVHDYCRGNRLLPKVVLVPAAHRFMVGRFKTEPPLPSRTMLGYELERLLPISAEEFACDFLTHGDTTLGVAVAKQELQPLVDQLETQGMRIWSIAPAPLLALQSWARENALNDFDWVLWESDGHCELLQLAAGKVCSWIHLTAEPQTIRRAAAAEAMSYSGDIRVAAIGLAEASLSALRSVSGLDITLVATQGMREHAARFAALTAAGRQRPWVELRRGDLASGDRLRGLRGGINALAVAALISFVTLTVANVWVTQRRQLELRQLQTAQATAFREVFPGTAPPTAVFSRLRSEKTKLIGARAGTENLQLPTSALRVLLPLLRSVPEQSESDFQRVRIESGALDLEVELPSFSAADELATALRGEGFEVDPPTTTQASEEGVVARIFARLPRGGAAEDEREGRTK